ncbi:hypothetical protein A2223_03115 [Candidatus Falkowbacteria bacterium RIFOXYA2_FULL_35_8]|uniref:Uncharacterized protein n=1 Tax=Candidatus Falkowbacteria bacterium RIFOXYC2_FULL_36_12 TaxID=1798002 RepID=A0A1F5SYU3_9BACT|nr:MAG: hypothetical protein A2300_01325 [Candidatus Falkowbacteria bacterium RIFOXYB2_FULL_35_7]OGF31870.1 MAG: hypothetical protein A2478_05300 [Candidatus Falkowbacteria bacterium RIFOXYC2_FULL_36_12]OGF33629.1 MAG: hypothetical protein A2223_03115 [Candidatus Falkowbacteria bacterium RIFOXYA2_FULL_35_8]
MNNAIRIESPQHFWLLLVSKVARKAKESHNLKKLTLAIQQPHEHGKPRGLPATCLPVGRVGRVGRMSKSNSFAETIILLTKNTTTKFCG